MPRPRPQDFPSSQPGHGLRHEAGAVTRGLNLLGVAPVSAGARTLFGREA
jgi:hypothetical protein